MPPPVRSGRLANPWCGRCVRRSCRDDVLRILAGGWLAAVPGCEYRRGVAPPSRSRSVTASAWPLADSLDQSRGDCLGRDQSVRRDVEIVVSVEDRDPRRSRALIIAFLIVGVLMMTLAWGGVSLSEIFFGGR
jgi:hypothetical protein